MSDRRTNEQKLVIVESQTLLESVLGFLGLGFKCSMDNIISPKRLDLR